MGYNSTKVGKPSSRYTLSVSFHQVPNIQSFDLILYSIPLATDVRWKGVAGGLAVSEPSTTRPPSPSEVTPERDVSPEPQPLSPRTPETPLHRSPSRSASPSPVPRARRSRRQKSVDSVNGEALQPPDATDSESDDDHLLPLESDDPLLEEEEADYSSHPINLNRQSVRKRKYDIYDNEDAEYPCYDTYQIPRDLKTNPWAKGEISHDQLGQLLDVRGQCLKLIAGVSDRFDKPMESVLGIMDFAGTMQSRRAPTPANAFYHFFNDDVGCEREDTLFSLFVCTILTCIDPGGTAEWNQKVGLEWKRYKATFPNAEALRDAKYDLLRRLREVSGQRNFAVAQNASGQAYVMSIAKHKFAKEVR